MNSLISFASIPNMPDDPGFATYFSHLLKTRTFVDVTFKLETSEGEIEFFAHQLVLSMRSSYFADTFYGNNKQQLRTLRFKNMKPKAFEAMIRYCYGCKPGLENNTEACELFKIAKEFNIVSLMNLCRNRLRDIDIKPNNVFTMLDVSKYMNDKSLEDRCKKLLEDNTREVIAFYQLSDVTSRMVHSILVLQKLALYSEYELIKWLFDWAQISCQEEDCNCDNARDFLEKLLQEMNFLALTFEEFAKLCKDYPNFFSCTEIASIYMNLAIRGSREMPDWHDKDVKIRQYTGERV